MPQAGDARVVGNFDESRSLRRLLLVAVLLLANQLAPLVHQLLLAARARSGASGTQSREGDFRPRCSSLDLVLVQVFDRVQQLVGAGAHRAQLPKFEYLVARAHSVRVVEHRSARFQLDERGQHQQKRCEQQ